MGHGTVSVLKKPRVAIIATGDELVTDSDAKTFMEQNYFTRPEEVFENVSIYVGGDFDEYQLDFQDPSKYTAFISDFEFFGVCFTIDPSNE